MAEIESEGELSRSEIADFFREFADELDTRTHRAGHERETDRTGRERDAETRETDRTAGEVARERTGTDDEIAHERTGSDEEGGRTPERMTIVVGGDSATLTLPETMEFDVEVASRSPLLSSGVTQSIQFDLEWEIEEIPDDESMEVI